MCLNHRNHYHILLDNWSLKYKPILRLSMMGNSHKMGCTTCRLSLCTLQIINLQIIYAPFTSLYCNSLLLMFGFFGYTCMNSSRS